MRYSHRLTVSATVRSERRAVRRRCRAAAPHPVSQSRICGEHSLDHALSAPVNRTQMASSVSPCSAKVFIRFTHDAARLVLDARHCPAHIPPSSSMVLSMLSAFLSPLALASRRDNAHKAMRSPSHTRRARVKNFDAFTVDVVRRDVRQTRKPAAIFCSRYSYSSAFVSASLT